MEEERALRLGIVLAGHLMWLSTAALRIVHGHRERWITTEASWFIQYFPTLVWLPLLVAFFLGPARIALSEPLPPAGLAFATLSAAFAAAAMWTLGRSYGIRLDLFKGHQLKTNGVYALTRHPMYLGILGYHLGASIALESAFLIAVTAFVILPYTALRIGAEERVLEAGFGAAFDDYRRRTPRLLPVPR